MYKTIYDNAKTMADRIQAGELRKQRKQPQREGLLNRPLLQDEATEEDAMSIISRYIATINEDAEAMRNEFTEPAERGVHDYSNVADFAEALAMSESSGRSDVQISTESGGRQQTMTGLFQFSEGRLEDYMNDTGASFSVEDFRQDEGLQRDVFAWHIQDIDRVIDENDLLDKGFSRDGLRAVGHLGGITGMLRFARTGGRYNPEDEFGTSLRDYYNKFGDA